MCHLRLHSLSPCSGQSGRGEEANKLKCKIIINNEKKIYSLLNSYKGLEM